MYCNIVIQLERVTAVITELNYSPEQRRTFHCEFIPERLEILGGYAMDEDGEDLYFEELVEAHQAEVLDHCLSWYKEDLKDYDEL